MFIELTLAVINDHSKFIVNMEDVLGIFQDPENRVRVRTRHKPEGYLVSEPYAKLKELLNAREVSDETFKIH